MAAPDYDRRARVGAAIQRELSSALCTELDDPRLRWLGVTAVRLNGDRSCATVYVSRVCGDAPSEAEVAAALRGLARASRRLRARLASRLALRATPTLRFRWDERKMRERRLDCLLSRAGIDSPSADGA